MAMMATMAVAPTGCSASQRDQSATFDKRSGIINGLWLDVTRFGVSDVNSAEENHAAFNRAIAAGNRLHRQLYIPAGIYRNVGALDTITGPGLFGEASGETVIHHLSQDSCIVTRGSYKMLSNITIINKLSAGRGDQNSACFHIVNCAYGRFAGLYAAHDLDDYSGIMLEQQYDGSADDAAFLTHLGCWYNHFASCTTNYVLQGQARGFGFRFRVAPTAREVVDPVGQAHGRYSGECSYNIIDLPNIEQRVEGLRIEDGVCNQIRGGQFLGCETQVSLSSSSSNLFVGTRHNQWTRRAFSEEGLSANNVILYPVLFHLSTQPWSIGNVGPKSVVVRGDQRGTWSPRLTFGGKPVRLSRASGTFANNGGIVQVNCDIRLAETPAGQGVMEISGLPFPAVNDQAEGLALCNFQILDHGAKPRVSGGRLASGYCSSTTITAISDHLQDITAEHFGAGAIVVGNMTYFTRWV